MKTEHPHLRRREVRVFCWKEGEFETEIVSQFANRAICRFDKGGGKVRAPKPAMECGTKGFGRMREGGELR
jgi:hypothetical protein